MNKKIRLSGRMIMAIILSLLPVIFGLVCLMLSKSLPLEGIAGYARDINYLVIILCILLSMGLLYNLWPITNAEASNRIMRGRNKTYNKVWLSRCFLKAVAKRNKRLKEQGHDHRWKIMKGSIYQKKMTKAFYLGNNSFLALRDRQKRL